ncbi:MAG TPA: hypothetical protein VGI67_16715 [Thermoleophilaceae bacterium]|jgi:fatty acid desaturase
MSPGTRSTAAVVMAICGGLAALYLFFALVGTVDLGRAGTASLVALLLAAVWLVGVLFRAHTGPTRVQRIDRERRGF